MKKNIDKYFKEKLESAEIAPSQDLWTKLEGKLDAFEKPIENRSRGSVKLYWLTGIAAALTAIAAMLSPHLWHYHRTDASHIQAHGIKNNTVTSIDKNTPTTVQAVKAETPQPYSPSRKKIAQQVPDNSPAKAETDNLEASAAENHSEYEEWQIPVYSLKLPYQQTSTSLTEKITIISGEPQKGEVNEELNRKQLIIFQRLQLLQQSGRYKN